MQPYLARAGYGSMQRQILLQPENGKTPLDSERLLALLGPAIGSKTRSAVSTAKSAERAGLILGSPEFMRC
jgi:hypothetical protein